MVERVGKRADVQGEGERAPHCRVEDGGKVR